MDKNMASAREVLSFPYAYLQRLGAPTIAFAKIELNLPKFTVGRCKHSSFIIPDLIVSRKHATFKTIKNDWMIKSVGMNGTLVNGVLLPKSTLTALKHLDTIEFGFGGKFVYKFCVKSVDVGTGGASKCHFAMESRPYAKDSPAAFGSFAQSRKSQEHTLMEENVQHDYLKFYGNVYYNHLMEKEEKRRKNFYFTGLPSRQLGHRKSLLKVLLLMRNVLDLSPTTYHLAVHLLAIFLDHHEIDNEQLMLAASSCLLVSAKFVDVDKNVPKISRLQELNFPYDIYSTCDYKDMELSILNFWRWDLNFATSLHFLEYFMTGDMLSRSTEGLVPCHLHLDDFKQKVLELADLALLEAEFVYFKSSKVAAACIATTRFIFGLEPKWPRSMEVTTGYRYVDIQPCVELLRDLTQFRMRGLVIQPALEYEHHEASVKTETKWKGKAPPTSYSRARNKRRPLLSKQGIKRKMYYCQV